MVVVSSHLNLINPAEENKVAEAIIEGLGKGSEWKEQGLLAVLHKLGFMDLVSATGFSKINNRRINEVHSFLKIIAPFMKDDSEIIMKDEEKDLEWFYEFRGGELWTSMLEKRVITVEEGIIEEKLNKESEC